MNPNVTRRCTQWLLVLLLIGYWAIVHFVYPTPFYVRYDPEMAYSFSSLSVFKGLNYTYIDHPGTPVEIVGTFLYALTFPLVTLTHQDFVHFHVAHPELFLAIARALLTLAGAFCSVLLFRFSVVGDGWLDLLKALAVALSFFMVHPGGLASLTTWSHNSFAFPFGTLVLFLLFLFLRRREPIRWKHIGILGLLAGMLGSVQLYFITWIVGVAASLVARSLLEGRSWWRSFGVGVAAILASGLGFLLGTLPIVSQYGELWTWISQLAFHQGIYGSGIEGITSFESLMSGFIQLWTILPALFIVSGLALLTMAFLVAKRGRAIRTEASLWACAIGLSMQLVVTLVVVLKHPGVAYMLGVAAILPVLLAVLLALIGSSGFGAKAVGLAFSLAVLLGFGASLVNAVQIQIWLRDSSVTLSSQIDQHVQALAGSSGRSADSVVVLWTYPLGSPCFARMFGNDYVLQHGLGEEITAVCRNDFQYNIWYNSIRDAAGTTVSKTYPWDMMVVSPQIFDSEKFRALRYLGKATRDGGLVFITNERTAGTP